MFAMESSASECVIHPQVTETKRNCSEKRLDKRVCTDENGGVFLSVSIQGGAGIDNPPRPTSRINGYRVIVWIGENEEYIYCTRIVAGRQGQELKWDQKLVIQVESPHVCPYLKLEVVRLENLEYPTHLYNMTNMDMDHDEPGTSYGVVNVGRAKIPLPRKLYDKKEGNFQLVRIQGNQVRPEGTLGLSTQFIDTLK